MSALTVNVEVGTTPPSTSVSPGTGLTVAAWKMSLFLRNPSRSAGVPAGSADATGTTDGSGNVTLTGLSSVNYWIQVVDARGVNNWFPVLAARIGGVDAFVCTIPWSTPTTVTAPLDDRGGDTPGGATRQGLWAPRTHVHQFAGASGIPTGTLVFAGRFQSQSVSNSSAPLNCTSFYDPYSGFAGPGYNVPAALAGLNLTNRATLTVLFSSTGSADLFVANFVHSGGSGIFYPAAGEIYCPASTPVQQSTSAEMTIRNVTSSDAFYLGVNDTTSTASVLSPSPGSWWFIFTC